VALAALAALAGLVLAEPALADHCQDPSDCFQVQRSALAAAIGVTSLAAFSLFLDFLPFVGTAKGFVQLLTGRDLITGERLSTFDRLTGWIPFAAGKAAGAATSLGALRGAGVLGDVGRLGRGAGDLGGLRRAPGGTPPLRTSTEGRVVAGGGRAVPARPPRGGPSPSGPGGPRRPPGRPGGATGPGRRPPTRPGEPARERVEEPVGVGGRAPGQPRSQAEEPDGDARGGAGGGGAPPPRDRGAGDAAEPAPPPREQAPAGDGGKEPPPRERAAAAEEPEPGRSGSEPEAARSVGDTIGENGENIGRPGRSRGVRELDTPQEIRDLYDQLAQGGTPVGGGSYPGEAVQHPDGTRIGLRSHSKSGGVTLDIRLPNGRIIKVHLP
jgi:hypothetical protein